MQMFGLDLEELLLLITVGHQPDGQHKNFLLRTSFFLKLFLHALVFIKDALEHGCFVY